MVRGPLTADEVRRLVDEKVREGKHLDYKQSVKLGDNDARELCLDITSFANTEGGWILVGLKEAKHSGDNLSYPEAVVAHDLIASKFIERVEHLVEASVWPHLGGLTFEVVDMPSGLTVLGVHIPASPLAPHMVDRDKKISCARRNNHGKQLLDAEQLKDAILRSMSIEDRFDAFVGERRAGIDSNLQKYAIQKPVVVVHAFPRSFLEATLSLTLDDLKPVRGVLGAGDLGSANLYRASTVGIVAVTNESYSILFKSGGFESVSTSPFSRANGSRTNRFIAGAVLQPSLMGSVRNALETMQRLTTGPLFISGSLMGVAKFEFLNGGNYLKIANENVIELAPLEIDGSADLEKTVEPWMDTVANTFGAWKWAG